MIVKAEAQTWEYPDGTTEYGLVWLEMANGDVYSRSVLNDETLEGLVAKFEASKVLDEDCALFQGEQRTVTRRRWAARSPFFFASWGGAV